MPSSRSGSYSAVWISAGGTPRRFFPASGTSYGWFASDFSLNYTIIKSDQTLYLLSCTQVWRLTLKERLLIAGISGDSESADGAAARGSCAGLDSRDVIRERKSPDASRGLHTCSPTMLLQI